jgi:CTP:molybdopterin cytidylyltransferase MocA/HD superfamily phosphohydrolase YqeK
MHDYKIGAVIVAGGLSSRMNDFKPLLPIGNKSMIETTINNFKNFGVEKVVGVTGYRSEDIKTNLKEFEVEFVENVNYHNTHMFDSVCLGLRELKNIVDFIFISPADSPFVQQFTLNKMMEEMINLNYNLIQPSYEGKNGHPLLLSQSAVNKILCHDGTNGLQGAIANMVADDYKNLSFVDPGIILDADTMDDYLKLLEYNESKNYPTIEQCKKIQDYFSITPAIKAHCEKVASVALNICDNINKNGVNLNKNKVVAASLLHDIAKGKDKHAEVGALWLKDMGYDEISEIVKEHMELKEISKIPNEKEVVYLADKLVKGEKLVSIKERFSFKEGIYKNDNNISKSIDRRKEQAKFLYYMFLENVGIHELQADYSF